LSDGNLLGQLYEILTKKTVAKLLDPNPKLPVQKQSNVGVVLSKFSEDEVKVRTK
jgi:hypothetical protein